MNPVRPTCEYLRNPLGIDVARPRLSWALASDRRGEAQTAYQVLVASSEELLKADEGDLWDSGKVESDQSAFVEYAGRRLASERRCYWKVRIWDRSGKPSDWSENAYWTMGLLKPSDWKGKWIANRAKLDPDETAPDTLKSRDANAPSIITQKIPSPLLRKAFEVPKPIKRATAYICGLGFHELRINGHRVGDSVLEPAFTRYDKRALYLTHDVTDLVHQGSNAIGVMLGNGWYNCHSRDSWNFDHAPWRNTPRLLFQMRLEYADGSSDVIVSDGSWKTATGPIVFDCIRNGEFYDARLEKPGWDAPIYSDADWRPALIVDGPGGKLVAQKTLPVKVVETAKPVKLTEPKPGVFVFDMGRNISGWCRLTVLGPAGTTVTIRYDERLNDDGTLNQHNAAHIRTGEFQTDKYTLKGDGVETWEPRFVYNGFQYAQVEGFPGRPTLDSLQLRIVHVAFDENGSFECSNGLINQLQTLARRSYVSNFVGYPTDCPHREKNGWTGDAHIAAEMGLYNFDPESCYTRWIDDFDDCMKTRGGGGEGSWIGEPNPNKTEGDLPGIVPTGTWGYGTGPSWDSAYLLIPWYVYQYRGDARLLKSHYAGFKRYVDHLTARSEGHILSFGLGDWCPPEGGSSSYKTPRALTSTGYYYVDARILSEVARMLGRKDDARKYAGLAEEIRKAFIARFYHPETGTFEGDEQCGMAAALYQGLIDSKEKPKVMAALVDDVANKRNGHVWAGILGTKYLLHALTDNGRADLAYRVATQRDFPGWGYWVERGATSFWENWNGGGSRNHIMFGDISAWFYEALAGINPDPAKPGFKHIIIRPNPVGDLKWVRAEHRTTYGLIRVSWKRDNGDNNDRPANPLPDGRPADRPTHDRPGHAVLDADSQGHVVPDVQFTLHVEIPANTTATVYIPAASADAVMEDGVPAAKAQCVRFVKMESGCAVFEIESGVYTFTAM